LFNWDTSEIENISNLTCGNNIQDFVEKYSIYRDSYDCLQIQFAGIERCGCPDLWVNPCNLCEDKNEHYNPDTVITDLYNWRWATCFDAAADISFYAAGDEQLCSAYQATVGERCGCNNPIAHAAVGGCSLCGDHPIPDPSRMFDGDTRASWEQRVVYDCNYTLSEEYSGYYAPATEYCCAEEAAPTAAPSDPPPFLSLCNATPCVDGSVPHSDFAEVELDILLHYGLKLTCSNVHGFVEENLLSQFECDYIIAEAGIEKCGCPRPDFLGGNNDSVSPVAAPVSFAPVVAPVHTSSSPAPSSYSSISAVVVSDSGMMMASRTKKGGKMLRERKLQRLLAAKQGGDFSDRRFRGA
jgi:hypothetical protein